MHLYRLTGKLILTDLDPERPDTCQRHEIHILAASVLWPDPLTDDQVEAHVMTDLLDLSRAGGCFLFSTCCHSMEHDAGYCQNRKALHA